LAINLTQREEVGAQESKGITFADLIVSKGTCPSKWSIVISSMFVIEGPSVVHSVSSILIESVEVAVSEYSLK
jgi:hypothetical protein